MKIEGSFEIDAPRETVYACITDPLLMSSCVPGCERIEALGDNRYRSVVVVGIGSIQARFNLMVSVTREEAPSLVESQTRGEEGSRSSRLAADNVVRLEEVDSNRTRLNYASEVSVTGALGKFALGVMKKKVESLGDEFAARFRAAIVERIATGPAKAGTAPSSTSTPTSTPTSIPASTRTSTLPSTPSPLPASTPGPALAGSIASPLRVAPTNDANARLRRPRSLDEALTLIATLPDARLLAGGASLVAMINAGVASPGTIVSLAGIAELRGIERLADGRVRIGAFTRHRETAASALLHDSLAGVRSAASQIANATVRNMGTIGGAIALADPSLDYPPALVAARAVIEVASVRGTRRVDAADFFVDWYTTALAADEMVTAIELPAPVAGVALYHKLARVVGDYATVSIALVREVEPTRTTPTESAVRTARTRVAVGACGPRPIRSNEADALLAGKPTKSAIAEAGAILRQAADPIDDVRGTAAYRRMLIPGMLGQAFELANLQAEAT